MRKNQMYEWIDSTWNPIRGECPHKCSYCYVPHSRVKHLYEGELHLVEPAFKPLGHGKTIFVGSMFDIWADEIPTEWLVRILEHCRKYDNTYLFQSKNPQRFISALLFFPDNFILGTTIETNHEVYLNPELPSAHERAGTMAWLKRHYVKQTMVSIEPIIDFDVEGFIEMLGIAEPSFVSIGADSKNHHLVEPSPEKVEALIKELEKFTEVRKKDNLMRLLKQEGGK